MFSALLRGYRKHLHLTQAELAKRSGISRTHIASLETGRRGPDDEQIQRLSAALRLDPKERERFTEAGNSARADQDTDLAGYVDRLERRLRIADERLRTFIQVLTRIRDTLARKGVQLPQDILDAISGLEHDLGPSQRADDPIRRPG
jgi:transcriptional regulator with XRE-family HTH domain